MTPFDPDRDLVDPSRLRPRPSRAAPWLGAVGLAVVCGAVGYTFGSPPTETLQRSSEAVGDLAVPLAGVRGRKANTERLRAEVNRFLEVQEWFFRENGRMRQPAEIPLVEGGFRVRYDAPDDGGWWVVEIRDADAKPGDPSCAAAVGRVPAYVGGITLRRSGQVRCSTDLATKLNGLWRRIVPAGLGGH